MVSFKSMQCPCCWQTIFTRTLHSGEIVAEADAATSADEAMVLRQTASRYAGSSGEISVGPCVRRAAENNLPTTPQFGGPGRQVPLRQVEGAESTPQQQRSVWLIEISGNAEVLSVLTPEETLAATSTLRGHEQGVCSRGFSRNCRLKAGLRRSQRRPR